MPGFTKESIKVLIQLYLLICWQISLDGIYSRLNRIFIPFNTTIAKLFELERVYPDSAELIKLQCKKALAELLLDSTKLQYHQGASQGTKSFTERYVYTLDILT